MNPTPDPECVFPLSVGASERPALRPPKLSLPPPAVAEVCNELTAARLVRAAFPWWPPTRDEARRPAAAVHS